MQVLWPHAPAPQDTGGELEPLAHRAQLVLARQVLGVPGGTQHALAAVNATDGARAALCGSPRPGALGAGLGFGVCWLLIPCSLLSVSPEDLLVHCEIS